MQVVVRKRPANESETDVIDCPEGTAEVLVHEHKLKVDLTRYLHTHRFSYDHRLVLEKFTPVPQTAPSGSQWLQRLQVTPVDL